MKVTIADNNGTVELNVPDPKPFITLDPPPPSASLMPTGGTTGQVLTKSSNNDYATEWKTPAAPTTGDGGNNPPQTTAEINVLDYYPAATLSSDPVAFPGVDTLLYETDPYRTKYDPQYGTQSFSGRGFAAEVVNKLPNTGQFTFFTPTVEERQGQTRCFSIKPNFISKNQFMADMLNITAGFPFYDFVHVELRENTVLVLVKQQGQGTNEEFNLGGIINPHLHIIFNGNQLNIIANMGDYVTLKTVNNLNAFEVPGVVVSRYADTDISGAFSYENTLAIEQAGFTGDDFKDGDWLLVKADYSNVLGKAVLIGETLVLYDNKTKFVHIPHQQNGKNAYELAKDNGFTGTLQEWLNSLKGEDGQGNGEVSRAIINYNPEDNKTETTLDFLPFTPNTLYADGTVSLTGTPQTFSLAAVGHGDCDYVAVKLDEVPKSGSIVIQPHNATNMAVLLALTPGTDVKTYLENIFVGPVSPSVCIMSMAAEGFSGMFGFATDSEGGNADMNAQTDDTGIKFTFMTTAEYAASTGQDPSQIPPALAQASMIRIYGNQDGVNSSLGGAVIDPACTELYIVLAGNFYAAAMGIGDGSAPLAPDETLALAGGSTNYTLPQAAVDGSVLFLQAAVTLLGHSLKSGDFFELYDGKTKGILTRVPADIPQTGRNLGYNPSNFGDPIDGDFYVQSYQGNDGNEYLLTQMWSATKQQWLPISDTGAVGSGGSVPVLNYNPETNQVLNDQNKPVAGYYGTSFGFPANYDPKQNEPTFYLGLNNGYMGDVSQEVDHLGYWLNGGWKILYLKPVSTGMETYENQQRTPTCQAVKEYVTAKVATVPVVDPYKSVAALWLNKLSYGLGILTFHTAQLSQFKTNSMYGTLYAGKWIYQKSTAAGDVKLSLSNQGNPSNHSMLYLSINGNDFDDTANYADAFNEQGLPIGLNATGFKTYINADLQRRVLEFGKVANGEWIPDPDPALLDENGNPLFIDNWYSYSGHQLEIQVQRVQSDSYFYGWKYSLIKSGTVVFEKLVQERNPNDYSFYRGFTSLLVVPLPGEVYGVNIQFNKLLRVYNIDSY